MNTQTYSQTQLSNLMATAGLIVLIANQFGWILDQNKVAFILGAVWTIGWQGYNFYQRYAQGDLRLSGVRKIFNK